MDLHRFSAFDYMKLVVGSALVAAAFQFFTFPNSIVSGGVTGIAQIIRLLTGIPVGVLSILINIPIFYLGWRHRLGTRRLILALCVMALISVLIDTLALTGLVVTDEPMLGAVYGGVLNGAGYGLIYTTGTTGGGTDIVAKMLRRRYPYINFGTLLFGTLMAASPTVRAAVARWFTEYSETGENQWLSYFFTGDIVYTSEDEPMPVFTITALPEGYEERADKRARFASTIAASFYYKADEGEDYSISLTYTYMQDDTRWHYPADPERYVYRPVAVNGHEGMLGIYREENGSERCNSIIWMDEETNFQFQISFAWEELQLTENELIAMAESVQMQES